MRDLASFSRRVFCQKCKVLETKATRFEQEEVWSLSLNWRNDANSLTASSVEADSSADCSLKLKHKILFREFIEKYKDECLRCGTWFYPHFPNIEGNWTVFATLIFVSVFLSNQQRPKRNQIEHDSVIGINFSCSIIYKSHLLGSALILFYFITRRITTLFQCDDNFLTWFCFF